MHANFLFLLVWEKRFFFATVPKDVLWSPFDPAWSSRVGEIGRH